ncbi:MAG: protein kinase [Acidobacteriota bacterium]
MDKPSGIYLAGQILDGKYELIAQLGEGGMAIVYRARRLRIGDEVAVKVLRPEITLDTISQARFEREAQAAARIKHPNIITIHDFGTSSDGLTYLVMELLTGPTLEAELRSHGALSVERALSFLLPVCQAIGAAHEEGIIHRDLKPSNILLHKLKDGSELIKVVDFGIVKLGRASERLTQVNNLLGTPHYMSPEQCYSRELDARSDVYSLGIIAYELLSGQVPFNEPVLLDILQAHVKQPPPPLRRIRAEIPSQIEAVIMRALSKQPAQRPANAVALAQELMTAAGIPLTPLTSTPLSVKIRTTENTSPLPLLSSATYLPTQTDSRPRDTLSRRLVKTFPDFDQFLGRRREMERMAVEYQHLLSGKARPIVLLGEQGVGLSRLGEEFKTWARRQGAAVLLTRFYEPAARGQLPFQLWLDLLRRMIGVARKDLDSEAHLAELTAEQMGVELPGCLLESHTFSEAEKWRVFEAVVSVALRCLSDRAGVLIFDNLHLADQLSLELLAYLLRQCRTRVLFIFLARSEQLSDKGHRLQEWLATLASSGGYEALSLQPLSISEVRNLLDAIFGRTHFVERDIEQLWSVSQGNPYYIGEIVRLLLNEGKLVLKEDQWCCEDLENITLPQSLQQLAELKLARLDEQLIELLRQAAVIGREFTFSLLERISGLDEDKLINELERAVKENVIKESQKSDEGYYFHNPTLQLVLYEGIPRRRRRKLHLQTAQAIEAETTNNQQKLLRQSAQLLYHYHEAGQAEKTFHYGPAAAEAARSRLAMAEAESYYAWALAAAQEMVDTDTPPDPAEWAKLQLGAAEVALHLGQLNTADQALGEAQRLAQAAENAALLAHAQLIKSQLELNRSQFEAALVATEEGLGAAEQAEDPVLEGQLLLLLARAYRALGRFEEAFDALECALEIVRHLGDHATESQILSLLGSMLGFAGQYKKGRDFAEEALKLARKQKDRLGEMMALLRLGQIYWQCAQLDQALEAYELGLELARALESRLNEGSFQNGLGDVFRSLAEIELARDCYQQYLTIAESVGNQSGKVHANHKLGLIALELGILPDAVNRLVQACEEHVRLGEVRLVIEAHCGLGQAYEQTGQLQAAQTAYSTAIDHCQHINYPGYEWQAHYGLASCLFMLGQLAGARAQVQAALEIIEQLRKALPADVNVDEFLRDKRKAFALLQDIDSSEK